MKISLFLLFSFKLDSAIKKFKKWKKIAIKNKVKSFNKRIDDHYAFRVKDIPNVGVRYEFWINKTTGDNTRGNYAFFNLNHITSFHNAARWLTSDKVNKKLKERIKFYSEKDSLFE